MSCIDTDRKRLIKRLHRLATRRAIKGKSLTPLFLRFEQATRILMQRGQLEIRRTNDDADAAERRHEYEMHDLQNEVAELKSQVHFRPVEILTRLSTGFLRLEDWLWLEKHGLKQWAESILPGSAWPEVTRVLTNQGK